ncbi:E3 ubiquitin-protein ligase NRDP1 [Dermatophagoides pteronyssinus]|uniref:E3 ubiquitin-protein ligase NRDP1 n=2 Tax=Dermatophagoides pteronyssinus TaxID=6956 RepID=A0ABQ8JCG2_DERPT|nr:E3 ubiquitin-protein ligase NRDP1-like [Dermatophagoides pteronyssinus]KAH9420123.1 E3 ubiquitin-protein ligase NRDP1 [Dermatophagoides pteronyssinus]
MGYDLARFPNGNVDEELICPICTSVLEEPLQAPNCEHAFCSACIKEWLDRDSICPVDRQPLTMDELKPVPRILRNLLARLDIICDNAEFGCQEVVKIESLQSHHKDCKFNPKRPIECSKGCGFVIPKDEIQNHNCFKDLRLFVEQESKKMEQQYQELKGYLNSIRDCLRQILPLTTTGTIGCALPPNSSSTFKPIPIWCHFFPRARVLRWGGLISTPDLSIQFAVKKALIDTGCPISTVNELMENSHERKWPPGLSTLEIRQVNRPLFDNYICRKITGQQAVLVTSYENQHMNDDMILEPGLIMIFAHGIEYLDSSNNR